MCAFRRCLIRETGRASVCLLRPQVLVNVCHSRVLTLLTRCLHEPTVPRTDCGSHLLSTCVSCQLGWAAARPILFCCDSFVVSHGWASARRNLTWQGIGSPHARRRRRNNLCIPQLTFITHTSFAKCCGLRIGSHFRVAFGRALARHRIILSMFVAYAGFGGLVGWAIARRQIRAGHSLAHPCSFRFTMGFPRQGRCSSPHCPSLWQGSGSPVRMAGLRLASVGWASSSPVRVGLGYTARPIGRLGRFRRRHLHCRAGVGHFRCSFGSAFSKQ